MYSNYVLETLARQQSDETARQARTAHPRPQRRTRVGWHFPKVRFPSRPHVASASPA